MARIPQNTQMDVQVSIKDLNDEIRKLKAELKTVKAKLPNPQEVENLKSAVVRLSKTPTYLDPLDVFRASGPAHMHGYVPSPGVTPGTTKFLREDATWQTAGGGAPGAHTHPSDEITHVGSGYIAANDVKEAIEELDSEKLARSGAQDMQGDLDMGGNAIGDVENLTFTGTVGEAIIDQARSMYMTGAGEILGVKLIDMQTAGVGEGLIDEVRRIDMNGIGRIDDVREGIYFGTNVGEGVIDGPRVIHMDGDDSDSEARIDGLEAVIFNNEPTKSYIDEVSRIEYNTGVEAGVSYSAEAGRSSWDTLEDTLVAYVASGASVLAIAFGWGVAMAVNGYNPA